MFGKPEKQCNGKEVTQEEHPSIKMIPYTFHTELHKEFLELKEKLEQLAVPRPLWETPRATMSEQLHNITQRGLVEEYLDKQVERAEQLLKGREVYVEEVLVNASIQAGIRKYTFIVKEVERPHFSWMLDHGHLFNLRFGKKSFERYLVTHKSIIRLTR